MSGALVDLVAIGVQDTYLTGDPQTTYFRQAYKRHTNFAMEPVLQIVEGAPVVDGWSQITLTRNGDLLSDVYFLCTNAIVGGTTMPCPYEEVQLVIGGQQIDTITSFETTAMFNLFATCLSQWGKAPTVGSGTAGVWTLPFFFSRAFQNSLPLCALQYHDVTLRIKWSSDLDLKVYPWKLYADYIQLDTTERSAFAAKPLTMLIEQHQRTPLEAIVPDATGYASLTFSHPVKSIYFAIDDDPSSAVSTIATAKLTFNGKDRIPSLPVGNYFGIKQIAAHTESTIGTGIYGLYSFALWANRVTPTGSCNFSRLDNARFEVTNAAHLSEKTTIYAVNWNFLKLEDGVGGLLYAN